MTSPTPRPELAEGPCPDLGVLRSWLDGEPHPADLEPHLAACPACRETVADLRDNADFAAQMIGALAPQSKGTHGVRLQPSPGQADAQRAPLQSVISEKRRMTLALPMRRWRVAIGALAAALALTFAVGTPAGRDAAAAFLAQFRGQRLAVVTLDPAFNRNPMSELERLGTVDQGRRVRPEEVKSVAEAAQRVGFDLKLPDPATLPTGLKPDPKIAVAPGNEMRFIFDRDKTRTYLQSVGRTDIAVPDNLHGATLVVRVPAAAMIQYESAAGGRDMGLSIGQAGEVTAGVDGAVSFEELRTFLLSLPNLSPNVAAQLRNFKDWRSTLPIPVQPDKVNWQATTVAGVEGLLLGDNSGLGSAVIWPKDGNVYGVVGSGKPAEVLRVANSLR
jgi:hypothetical protein